MKYNESNKPLVCMMTQSKCYKNTTKMQVKGVLWHSTGANNPNIKRYVQPDDNDPARDTLLKLLGKNIYNNDWNHQQRDAGLNCWVGKLADGTVTTVQTMPWDYRPWGCGSGKSGSCNDGWIQFEICEDNLKDKSYFDKIYKEACEITAYLCKMFNINPTGYVSFKGKKVPTILCHADSHSLGLGSNHGDVYNWFEKYDKDMDDVRKDVAALIGAATSKPETPSDDKPADTKHEYKVGEIVNFLGGKHYSNANAASGTAVKASKAKITNTYNGKHPYHLRAVNDAGNFIGGVYGWVDADTITPINATTSFKVGDTVKCKPGVTKYYGGKTMASWVPSTTLYVRAIEQDGKVLLVSTEKTKNVYTGRVNASDMVKV